MLNLVVRLVAVPLLALTVFCGASVAGESSKSGKKPAAKAETSAASGKAGAAAPAAQWQTVTMEELTMTMPASAKKLGTNALMKHYWASAEGNAAYLAMTIEKPATTNLSDDKLLEAMHKLVIDSLLDADIISKNADGKFTQSIKEDKDVSLGGRKGKEWLEVVQQVPITTRMFLSSGHVYAAVVINAPADDAATEKLFASMAFAGGSEAAK